MLHRIASKVLNRPLLINPHHAEIICSILAERIGIEPLVGESDIAAMREAQPNANRFKGEPIGFGRQRVYNRIDDTAVVTVEGELVNRGAWLNANSGLTSYEGIEAQLIAAASDEKVSRILLDVESPGGEATGAMELAAAVRKISSEKPIYAFVNGMAASAAYAMVSGAKRIYSTPTGLSGSIGVVLLHLDRSAQLEKAGIKPTLIFAGAHKVDGHPFGPLPESVADDLKAEVAMFYQKFIETVAAGRSNLTEQAIRSTEARVFVGDDAVRVGLADEASFSFSDVLADISKPSSSTSSLSKGFTMKEENITVDAKVIADATAAGAKAAQDRISSILSLPAAQKRSKLANHIAFKTAMSLEEAKLTLEASAEEATQSVTPIEERANNSGIGFETVLSDKGKIAAFWDDIVKNVNASSKKRAAI